MSGSNRENDIWFEVGTAIGIAVVAMVIILSLAYNLERSQQENEPEYMSWTVEETDSLLFYMNDIIETNQRILDQLEEIIETRNQMMR